MTADGYVLRSWSTVDAGHECATVVDDRGNVVNVVMPTRYVASGGADAVIRHALATRPQPVPMHP